MDVPRQEMEQSLEEEAEALWHQTWEQKERVQGVKEKKKDQYQVQTKIQALIVSLQKLSH